MTLRRSVSALHSLSIFYQVDIVVFCEGGSPLPYDEAVRASPSDGTLDSLYWETVISLYEFEKKYHVKSVGSKLTLKKISEDVQINNVESVSVCLDSDYERIRNIHQCAPRVAWTLGYSWESDVLSPPALNRVISMLVGDGASGVAVREDFHRRISRLGCNLRRWTEIDISLCSRGRPGIFDRKKPLSAIDLTDPPNLREGELVRRLLETGYRRKPRRIISISSDEVALCCFGKMIARAIYHSALASIRGVCEVRVDYELFMRLAINATATELAAGNLPAHSAHIQSQREAFV